MTHPVRQAFKDASSHKQMVSSLYQDAYRYAIPNRDTFYNMGYTEGRDKTAGLYDSTAIDSTIRFANRIQSAMTPPYQRWVDFKAGRQVPQQERRRVDALLDAYGEAFFSMLHRTNFDSEINETFLDSIVGTGAIMIQGYDDRLPATFTAIPISELAFDEGPDGMVDRTFRTRRMKLRQIKNTWPNVRIPREMADSDSRENEGEAEFDVLEAVILNYEKRVYEFTVLWKDNELFKDRFEDVSPIVVSRWAKVAGEVWGRGPLLFALNDIRTLNRTMEMILQNASLELAGVYTAADDGVLNPETVEIAPGNVIPVSSNGGVNGRSLDTLPRAGNFDVGQIVLEDLRRSVKTKLFDEVLAPLDESVRSATEVQFRQQLLADQIGAGPFSRIQQELIFGVISRCAQMWSKTGDLPPVRVDGDLVELDFVSPLTTAQEQSDVRTIVNASQTLNSIVPGLSTMSFKAENLVPYITRRMRVPADLVAPAEQLTQTQQGLGQAAQEGKINISDILKQAQ